MDFRFFVVRDTPDTPSGVRGATKKDRISVELELIVCARNFGEAFKNWAPKFDEEFLDVDPKFD